MSELVSDALNLSRAGAGMAGALPRVLPDIAQDSIAAISRPLDRVGMAGVELAIRRTGADGVTLRTPARAEATVSLDDPDAKGIHMSRLFLLAQDVFDRRDLTPAAAAEAVTGFVTSHAAISHTAQLAVAFEHLVKRPALLSSLAGWRSYPVRIQAAGGPRGMTHTLAVRVSYSSTCPCSAALARQLIQERFLEQFGEADMVPMETVAAWLGTQRAIAGLPHSQRSHADITVRLRGEPADYPIDALIDCCEAVLRTPVQAAVRRADEQEFARLNGEQLMFCEDAARLLSRALDDAAFVADYHLRVQHLESLHPHDAVAVATKGVPGGLTA